MSTASSSSFKERLRVNSDEKVSKNTYGDVKCEVVDLVRELFAHAGVVDSFPKSLMPSGSGWDSVKCPSKSKIAKVGKTELAEFAEKACNLLVYRCYPALNHLYSDVEECERRIMQSQEELIAGQRSLVEAQDRLVKLQCQLLEKRDEEISAVQSTAEQEIKSFASVLEKECETALAPQRIRTAITSASEDKLCNLVGYGLADSKEEDDNDLWGKMFLVMKNWDVEMREIRSYYRLGRYVEGNNRPVKLVFKNRDTRKFVLENKARLRKCEEFKGFYLAPDRTPEERAARRVLVGELKVQRTQYPDKTFYIRGGKVVDEDDEE